MDLPGVRPTSVLLVVVISQLAFDERTEGAPDKPLLLKSVSRFAIEITQPCCADIAGM